MSNLVLLLITRALYSITALLLDNNCEYCTWKDAKTSYINGFVVTTKDAAL